MSRYTVITHLLAPISTYLLEEKINLAELNWKGLYPSEFERIIRYAILASDDNTVTALLANTDYPVTYDLLLELVAGSEAVMRELGHIEEGIIRYTNLHEKLGCYRVRFFHRLMQQGIFSLPDQNAAFKRIFAALLSRFPQITAAQKSELLRIAVKARNTPAVAVLCEQQAEIYFENQSALTLALQPEFLHGLTPGCMSPIIKLLLTRLEMSHQKPLDIELAFAVGYPHENSSELYKTLALAVADPNKFELYSDSKTQQTPLMRAAHICDVSAVKGLLECKTIIAKINQPDANGEQALCYVATQLQPKKINTTKNQTKAFEIIQLLCKQGADPNCVLKQVYTPFSIAISCYPPAALVMADYKGDFARGNAVPALISSLINELKKFSPKENLKDFFQLLERALPQEFPRINALFQEGHYLEFKKQLNLLDKEYKASENPVDMMQEVRELLYYTAQSQKLPDMLKQINFQPTTDNIHELLQFAVQHNLSYAIDYLLKQQEKVGYPQRLTVDEQSELARCSFYITAADQLQFQQCHTIGLALKTQDPTIFLQLIERVKNPLHCYSMCRHLIDIKSPLATVAVAAVAVRLKDQAFQTLDAKQQLELKGCFYHSCWRGFNEGIHFFDRFVLNNVIAEIFDRGNNTIFNWLEQDCDEDFIIKYLKILKGYQSLMKYRDMFRDYDHFLNRAVEYNRFKVVKYILSNPASIKNWLELSNNC